jgi:uncharacterized membrane protein YeaQ/YmgE (transglycosylase-associated protein family)
MKLLQRLSVYPFGVLGSALLISGFGVFFAFVWNEITLSVFQFAPRFSAGVDVKILVTVLQGFGAISTLISGWVGARLALTVLSYFSIHRVKEVALLASILWGIILYSYEIPTLEDNLLSHPKLLLLVFTVLRIGVDILSTAIFWYTIRRHFLRSTG